MEGLDVKNRDLGLVHDRFQADGLAISGRMYDRKHPVSLEQVRQAYAEENKSALPGDLEVFVGLLRLVERSIVLLQPVLELLLENDVFPLRLQDFA